MLLQVHIHTQSNLFAHSSPSIPCQTKYQKPRIIHSFVHGSLVKKGRSDVKVIHWYFLLAIGDLNYEFILVVIMPDANGNSVTICYSVTLPLPESNFSVAV